MCWTAISIHALLAESDRESTSIKPVLSISIHALLAESDSTIMLYDTSSLLFLSTLSLRRATARKNSKCRCQPISIHALLAESDRFYPLKTIVILTFLSTLSLRRATWLLCCMIHPHFYFYPRSPCGERLPYIYILVNTFLISIHALLAESDNTRGCKKMELNNFYPRSPCGERPRETTSIKPIFGISIHALLAESDGGFGVGSWPRVIFLSTLSLRRATPLRQLQSALRGDFYPRSPCGERPSKSRQTLCCIPISIHALLAESDRKSTRQAKQTYNFYPRSPCGERRCSGG